MHCGFLVIGQMTNNLFWRLDESKQDPSVTHDVITITANFRFSDQLPTKLWHFVRTLIFVDTVATFTNPLPLRISHFPGGTKLFLQVTSTIRKEAVKLTSMYFFALWSRARVVSLSGSGTCCLSTSRQSRNWARLHTTTSIKSACLPQLCTGLLVIHLPVLLQKIVSSSAIWSEVGECVGGEEEKHLLPQHKNSRPTYHYYLNAHCTHPPFRHMFTHTAHHVQVYPSNQFPPQPTWNTTTLSTEYNLHADKHACSLRHSLTLLPTAHTYLLGTPLLHTWRESESVVLEASIHESTSLACACMINKKKEIVVRDGMDIHPT